MFRSSVLRFFNGNRSLLKEHNVNQKSLKEAKTIESIRKRYELAKLSKQSKKENEEIEDKLVLQAYRELEEEEKARQNGSIQHHLNYPSRSKSKVNFANDSRSQAFSRESKMR
jgi:hypothetical protein